MGIFERKSLNLELVHGGLFSYLMTSLSSASAARCSDLWVLVNLLGVLLVAVYVEADGCSGAARTAETENDPGSISEDDPQALREREEERVKG